MALKAIPPSPAKVSPAVAYNGVVQCILEQPGVNPANISGEATMSDLGVAPTRVGACVNARFTLNPPIMNNEINGNTTVGTIAAWVRDRS
jgi:hypothetical protein